MLTSAAIAQCVDFEEDSESSRTRVGGLASERISARQFREALARQEISVQYQGKWDLLTGHLTGFEALARWRRPNGDYIPPSVFVPVAESDHSIRLLGDFVLRTALNQIMLWDAAGFHVPHVAVNLSLDEVTDHKLVQSILRAVRGAEVDPSRIQFEITESIAIHEYSGSIARLVELHKAGFSLALDDFGTGYSNLSGLRYLPIQTIKIDRSFVRASADSRKDYEILRTVVLLAKSLGLETVAEGIESEQQLGLLQDSGCQTGQGFYFSRPQTGEQVLALIHASETKGSSFEMFQIA